MSYNRNAAGMMQPPSRPGGVGPLQVRQAPNSQHRAPTHAKAHPSSTATPSARAPTSQAYHHPGSANAPRAQPARQAPKPPSQPQSQPHPRQDQQQQQQASNRPQSRLEREKKKDYKDPPNIGPWKLGKLIGQGASGRVRVAQHAQTGQQAAVKIVPRQLLANSRMSLGEMSQKQDKLTLGIEREIVIMKLIEHPNLLGLWDVYETSKELFLVMEYVAGGELFDHLVAKGRLRPSEARSYFRQIIFGVDYCHRFNICHRDLKPENLLLDGSKSVVKVADFGMAALQPVERMLETSCGSPHYASPEIVSGKSYKGSASDIWSCGIILFALLCGRLPFDDPNITRLLHKVKDGRFEMPENLEPAAKDLIWKMLEVDPERRLKMPEIMRHPWFTNNGAESSVNPSGPGEAMLGTEAQLKESEIDVEILKNLKSLWPELSTRHLVKVLTSPGTNWQKTFYSLLVQHRDNHGMDDEDESESEDEEESDVQIGHVLEQRRPTDPRAQSGVGAGQASAAQNSLGLSLGIIPNKPAAPAPAPPSVRVRAEQQEQQRAPRVQVVEATRASPAGKPSLLRAATEGPSPSARGSPASAARAVFQQLDAANGTPTRPPTARAYSQDAPRSPAPHGPRPAPPSPKADGRARGSFDQGRPLSTAVPAPPGSPERNPAGTNLSRRLTSPTHRGAREHDVLATPTRKSSLSSKGGPESADRRPTSMHAPSITVPQVGDATVQRFFQEIAAELASIRAASPTLATATLQQYQQQYQLLEDRRRSQDVERATNLHAQPSVRLAPSPVNSSAPPTPDLMQHTAAGDFNQFEDAEEDANAYEQQSQRSSVIDNEAAPYTPTSPLPPQLPPMADFGYSNTRPLSISEKGSSGGRLSSRPAAGPPSHRSVSPAPSAASNPRPTSIMYSLPDHPHSGPNATQMQQQSSSSGSGAGSSFLSKRRSLLGMRSQGSNKTSDDGLSRKSFSSERPTTSSGSSGRPVGPLQARLAHNAQPTKLQQRNPGLGLDLQNRASARSQQAGTVAAPGISSPTLPSAPNTPRTPSVPSTPNVKQSWFTGLFNWKPVSLSLLSAEGFIATQMEIKRLLLSSGARVFIEDSESLGAWRCSLKDNNSKTLRFRIEFTVVSHHTNSPASAYAGSPALSVPGTPISARFATTGLQSPALSSHSHVSTDSTNNGANYSTKVSLTLEKGSSQTFKNMYSHMQREWTLDPSLHGMQPPSSPAPAAIGLGVNM
ncbi:unnamed protein product [Parajaminaea phylloscopi]